MAQNESLHTLTERVAVLRMSMHPLGPERKPKTSIQAIQQSIYCVIRVATFPWRLLQVSTTTSVQSKLSDGVVEGHGNVASPSALPYRYNVLDWFHVTDVWCEKAPLRRWMVRFERVDYHSKSWWTPAQDTFPCLEDIPKVMSITCRLCGLESKAIYTLGWTCLNNKCTDFFNSLENIDYDELDYHADFLAERTPYIGDTPPPLSPQVLSQESQDEQGLFGTEKIYKKGIVCPECSCCTRRLDWRQWICENKRCRARYQLSQKPMSIEHAMHENANARRKIPSLCPIKADIVTTDCRNLGLYAVHDYVLPGEAGEPVGFVRLFKANPEINGRLDGPNDMFQAMQTHELYMKRRPARNAHSKFRDY